MAGATIVLFIMLTLINTAREKETSLSGISKEHVSTRQGNKNSIYRRVPVVDRDALFLVLSDVEGGSGARGGP